MTESERREGRVPHFHPGRPATEQAGFDAGPGPSRRLGATRTPAGIRVAPGPLLRRDRCRDWASLSRLYPFGWKGVSEERDATGGGGTESDPQKRAGHGLGATPGRSGTQGRALVGLGVRRWRARWHDGSHPLHASGKPGPRAGPSIMIPPVNPGLNPAASRDTVHPCPLRVGVLSFVAAASGFDGCRRAGGPGVSGPRD